jgi:heparan-alpha-glucosaminide N-acetyltransferase
MSTPFNTLKNQRIVSIDAFRGFTFLIMIIVNELAGVAGISPWLKHMPASADAMSFPDIVFPAFLFIVGMSIPFGINHRIKKGESLLHLNLHILLRTLALVVMGFFMVNAEDGYHQASMSLPIQLWALLSYLAFMLIWGVYQFKQPLLNRALVSVGVLMLIFLALSYRGGVDGTESMKPQWWGILGLIGWAYLISCIIYQVTKGKQLLLLLAVCLCTMLYIATHQANTIAFAQTNQALQFILSLDAHAAHSSIAICGILCSLIFFEESKTLTQTDRFWRAFGLMIALLIAATLLRPEFKVSKIYATPSWCFYSAGICIGVFGFLYWLIDLKNVQNWMRAIKPAAINPLVCYLLPFVIESILSLLGIRSPLRSFEGGFGILAALIYASLIMLAVHGLNKINFKLKF